MGESRIREASQRVLIVRIGAMGDVLHAMPAVAALRLSRPEWRVGWAIEPRWAPLLAAAGVRDGHTVRPLVDRIVPVATREWKKRPVSVKTLGEIAALRRDLRAERFDLCVDMQGSIRSAVIGRLAGAGELVGMEHSRETPARWFYGRRALLHAEHVIEQGCELLGQAASISLKPSALDFAADPGTELWCEDVLAKIFPEGGPFVLMAPTAGWGAKQWPAERFAELAVELGRRGFRTVVNVSGAEDRVAAGVVASSAHYAVGVGMNLVQLIAMTRRASAVIAGDTGPLHLAAAMGRPVVALFGPTDPARNGPYGTRSAVIRHGASRRDHRRRDEPEEGMLAITVEEVVAAATELLREAHTNGTRSGRTSE
jgi:heptosyltransferase I